MSAKPYHAGHDGLVRLAARENDEVHVFVSLSDRKRAGEDVPVLGKDMETLWRDVIEPTLPSNVRVSYGGSPIGNVWNELGTAASGSGDDVFRIYSDTTDMAQNFPENLLRKYGGDLFNTGRIILRPIERASVADVSGTRMRQALARGDRVAFDAGLPDTVDKDRFWSVLHATADDPPKIRATAKAARARRSESLVRELVNLILQG